jgi:hypothetical protein
VVDPVHLSPTTRCRRRERKTATTQRDRPASDLERWAEQEYAEAAIVATM